MRQKSSILDARKKIEEKNGSLLSTVLKKNNNDKTPSDKTLDDLFQDSRKLDFDCESVARIDNDIHDIFTRLKNRTGVKIGPLISAMLKESIDLHIDEIRTLLQNNKYL